MLFHVLIIIVALILLIPLLMMVFMMPMTGVMGWWTNAPDSSIEMFSLWGIGMMLLFLLALFGTGYLIYWMFSRRSFGVDDPALEELRLTYARGEISQDEFEQRQEDLRRSK
ncbi:SHOCT domain-containing protein [Halocatena marina]|uniref:SHOCT domain-containing protein n=1 Tax=Halocatena marina TaxID=2934937 RepID=A0ABD5YXW8_9EURY